IAQDERLQAEELLRRRVPVEVDAQSRLGSAAAPRAAGADPDVADRRAVPLHVAGIVRVVEEVVAERLPVLRVDRQVDGLDDVIVEERIGRRRRGLCAEERAARDEPERNGCRRQNGQWPRHQNTHWSRSTRLQNAAPLATGLRSVSSTCSRIPLNCSLTNRFKLQLTPSVSALSPLGLIVNARGFANGSSLLSTLSNQMRSTRAASSIAPIPPRAKSFAGLTGRDFVSPVSSQVPLTYHDRYRASGRSSSA